MLQRARVKASQVFGSEFKNTIYHSTVVGGLKQINPPPQQHVGINLGLSFVSSLHGNKHFAAQIRL